MLRTTLRKLGLIRTTWLLTVASIGISVGLTYAIMDFTSEEPSGIGLFIAVLAPGIMAPVFSYFTLRLVFHLEAAEEKLRHLSTTDDLTQVYNRRHFIQIAKTEWARARRYGEEFAIVIFDLDEFKRINDTYGHVVGDQVLRTVGEVCMREVRSTDTFARFGGDEFVFLIPKSAEIDLEAFIERVRIRLAQTRIPHQQGDIRFTVSIGAKRFDQHMLEFDTILMKADEALYRAKRNGGNRAEMAEETPIRLESVPTT
jgi:diguanylate cyclase (GGDEF)-like protein